MQINKEWLKNQVLQDTLSVFRVGCDEKNYRILKMLPSTIEELQKELKTKGVKPINTRVNMLEQSGLLVRVRGNGTVNPSPMTAPFLEIINQVTDQVENNVPKYMKDSGLL